MLWRNLFAHKPEGMTYPMPADDVYVEITGSCGTGVLVCAVNSDGELRDLDFIVPGAVHRKMTILGCDRIVLEPQGEGKVELEVSAAEYKRFEKVSTQSRTIQSKPPVPGWYLSQQAYLARELAKYGLREEAEDGDMDDYSFEDDNSDFVDTPFMEGYDVDPWTGHVGSSEEFGKDEAGEGKSGKAAADETGGSEQYSEDVGADAGGVSDSARGRNGEIKVGDKTA